jgi:hypothetical protein
MSVAAGEPPKAAQGRVGDALWEHSVECIRGSQSVLSQLSRALISDNVDCAAPIGPA